MEAATSFVSVHDLARHTGLAVAWLKAEAIGGRIPCLRTGRSLMFNVGAVERALLDRAAGAAVPATDPEALAHA